MAEPVQIKGGADPRVTAAILTAIQVALEEMSDAAPEASFERGSWVLAGRPRSIVGPRTDFRGLSPRPSPDGEEQEET